MPGHCALGERELELHPADGHTADGMAIWIPWARVLVVRRLPLAGRDPELSPAARSTPTSRRSRGSSRSSSRPTYVVPGHGEPLDAERAAAILREDLAYLEALRDRGADAPLPLARRTARRSAIHEDERLAARR